jgi:outer membrane biosynthesis protein TonB
MRRRPDPFDRRSLVASIGVHALLLLLALASTLVARPPLEFIAYEIELVSPPPAVQAEIETPATEELVVERPEPAPPPEPEPEPETAEVELPDPPPEPDPDPEPETAAPPEPDEEAQPATTTEEPEEEARESGEDINVRMEGLRRDFPAYYQNIITQIQRCHRWTAGGNWRTTVRFVIRPDGTVTDMSFATRSGNVDFDFEAMGAVDCAGRGRFGPLPEDLPWERLPIQFDFRPRGGRQEVLPDPNSEAKRGR